ncbi:Gfo/Idh/MocA family oxidoreductase [Ruficoccus amylovorans]|uniref:Gfo/Idh/MocA family oxidoreductase n=1 Tax=Ruficoccus amylovorans TaxID=1804625 RepID=A0A842HHI9_9BACT|nr:Gfo/Idh/MocA family oxidoreductase [Ruficoccus amylovorans]MBC2595872.1 Gfo/Idh/MocA family oxidoreductase [Ruficoccus amylovorans]
MSKFWQVAVVKDSSKAMLGLHGLHTAFRGLPNVEVVAHVDANNEELPRKLAQTQAKRHYARLEDMLTHEPPDIVVLCSRHPGDHLAQIRQVAEKGCHIYCEKPLSVLLEEADEVARVVEQTGIKLALAHPARHDLAFRTMKRMIGAGDIGTPLSVIGRGKCDYRGGGEDLIVLGTHILDVMTFCFGAPDSVTADIQVAGRPATLSDKVNLVEPVGPALGDEVFATFSFPSGVRGVFESRRDLLKPGQPAPHMGLCVTGTKGTLSLRFDDAARQPLLLSRQPGFLETLTTFEEATLREDRVIPGAEPLDYGLCGQPDVPRAPWFLEANRFAAWDLIGAIEEDRPPLSNIENARLAVEMIQGIYAAHLSRRTIDFPLVNRRHPLVG